jgi:hypothetical protein
MTVSKPHYCAFCGGSTTFMCYTPYLCVPCGDKVQEYQPAQVMDMAERFAECVARYKDCVTARSGKTLGPYSPLRSWDPGTTKEDP